MSAREAYRPRGFLAAARVRAEAFLLEPVPALVEPVPAAPSARPSIVVAGLAPRCGVTTVARALAAALAARDPAAAAVVACGSPPRVRALHTPAAGRLARVVGALSGEPPAPAGHLCITDRGDPAGLADAARHLAPLVIEVGGGEPAGAAASVADHVLLVTTPTAEPALAAAVAASLARVGPEPLVVMNKMGPRHPERRPAGIELPESRAAARLAQAGLVPRGYFGASVAMLAERCRAAP